MVRLVSSGTDGHHVPPSGLARAFTGRDPLPEVSAAAYHGHGDSFLGGRPGSGGRWPPWGSRDSPGVPAAVGGGHRGLPYKTGGVEALFAAEGGVAPWPPSPWSRFIGNSGSDLPFRVFLEVCLGAGDREVHWRDPRGGLRSGGGARLRLSGVGRWWGARRRCEWFGRLYSRSHHPGGRVIFGAGASRWAFGGGRDIMRRRVAPAGPGV